MINDKEFQKFSLTNPIKLRKANHVVCKCTQLKESIRCKLCSNQDFKRTELFEIIEREMVLKLDTFKGWLKYLIFFISKKL